MISIILFFLTYISCIFLALRNSAIVAFCLYQMVYFFNPEKRWWGNSIPDLSYSFYVVVLMLSLLGLNYKKFKENKVIDAKPLIWSYVILILYMVAVSYAVFPEDHWVALVYFIKLLIIITVAYKLCCTEQDLRFILYAYIAGAWYISFYAFQIGRNSGGRVEGIGTVDSPDANGLALAIAPSLVLCVYFYWIENKWIKKLMFAFAGVFIANAIVLINSRGAFLGVMGGMLCFMYFLYFSSVQRKNQKISAIFLLVMAFSGGLYVADDAFMQRMSGIASEAEVDIEQESGGTRMFYWKAAWDIAMDHPVGGGYRGFNYYAPEYLPQELDTGRKKSRSVHSTWFEALSEIGYIGLFSLIMLVISSISAIKNTLEYLKKLHNVEAYFLVVAILCAFLTFIIGMSFINRLRAEILYWLVLLVACSYNIYFMKVNCSLALLKEAK